MRRLLLVIFLTLFGLGLGLIVGAILMRRVDQAASKVAPEEIAARASRAATGFADRLRDAIDEGSRAASETEAGLRSRFGVPTVSEAAETLRERRGR